MHDAIASKRARSVIHYSVSNLSVTVTGVECSRRICNVQTQGKSLAPLNDSGGVEVSSNFAANVWEVIYSRSYISPFASCVRYNCTL